MSEFQPGHTYICEECRGTFTESWTFEEAQAERQKLFGGPVEEDDVKLCDPCFRRFMAQMAG